jgi:hypothetical protein
MSGDLYVRDGSRFVLYDRAAQHVPPIPVPVPQPTADNPTVEIRPNCWAVYAPRCPHGHFRRWAQGNCRPCAAHR